MFLQFRAAHRSTLSNNAAQLWFKNRELSDALCAQINKNNELVDENRKLRAALGLPTPKQQESEDRLHHGGRGNQTVACRSQASRKPHEEEEGKPLKGYPRCGKDADVPSANPARNAAARPTRRVAPEELRLGGSVFKRGALPGQLSENLPRKRARFMEQDNSRHTGRRALQTQKSKEQPEDRNPDCRTRTTHAGDTQKPSVNNVQQIWRYPQDERPLATRFADIISSHVKHMVARAGFGPRGSIGPEQSASLE